MITWVYIQSGPTLWTVGFYAPDGTWRTDGDHADRESASRRVAWLNGGRFADWDEFQQRRQGRLCR